jgi:DNA-binding NtrC family response regulator
MRKNKLFLVDDDALFLKSLEIDFLESGDFEIHTFATGELCMIDISLKPDFVILDFHLDGIEKNVMNGIETIDKITAYDATIPVIMLSSQDKIDVAITCMHHHACDYVVKSETAFVRLQKIMTNINKMNKLNLELNWYMNKS